jgi:muramoyltetrapeptide carboxypeptidase
MCGFPAGHDDINLPLVMGAPVTMDVRADGATLQFDIEGQQTEVQTSGLSTTKTPLESRLKRSGKLE